MKPLRHDRPFTLSPEAAADLAVISRWTNRTFGARQVATYRAAMMGLLRRLALDPFDPVSRPRPELGDGMRSARLDVVAPRARHTIFYVGDPSGSMRVIRILHDRMDVAGKLGSEPSGDTDDSDEP